MSIRQFVECLAGKRVSAFSLLSANGGKLNKTRKSILRMAARLRQEASSRILGLGHQEAL